MVEISEYPMEVVEVLRLKMYQTIIRGTITNSNKNQGRANMINKIKSGMFYSVLGSSDSSGS